MKRTTINQKWELLLPEHRANRPEWQTGWEVERISSMMDNLKEGDLVLDIGTEEGDISALLAQKTKNIILFEPNEKVWPNIRAIWEANKLPEPIAAFVGFAANEDNFHDFDWVTNFEHQGWPNCSTGELIGDHGFKELADPSNISRVKIDTFLNKSEHPYGWEWNVKLITMDVEGSEFEVLKGAEETIKRCKPLIYVSVHPEFMFRMFNQYSAELVKFVVDLGYKYEILAFDHEYHFLFKPI